MCYTYWLAIVHSMALARVRARPKCRSNNVERHFSVSQLSLLQPAPPTTHPSPEAQYLRARHAIVIAGSSAVLTTSAASKTNSLAPELAHHGVKLDRNHAADFFIGAWDECPKAKCTQATADRHIQSDRHFKQPETAVASNVACRQLLRLLAISNEPWRAAHAIHAKQQAAEKEQLWCSYATAA